MDILQAEHYAHPALVPVMPQRGGQAPHRPLLLDARNFPDGKHVRFLVGARTTEFAAYRFDGTRLSVPACELADATHLVLTGRTTGEVIQSFTDPTAVAGQPYTYVITALDRLHHQSPASLPRWAWTITPRTHPDATAHPHPGSPPVTVRRAGPTTG
jgi:hypothetical protein